MTKKEMSLLRSCAFQKALTLSRYYLNFVLPYAKALQLLFACLSGLLFVSPINAQTSPSVSPTQSISRQAEEGLNKSAVQQPAQSTSSSNTSSLVTGYRAEHYYCPSTFQCVGAPVTAVNAFIACANRESNEVTWSLVSMSTASFILAGSPGSYTFLGEIKACLATPPPPDPTPQTGQDGANTCQPITPATGEKQLFESDWGDSASHDLSIQRSYRSQVTGSFAGLTGLAGHWHITAGSAGLASMAINANQLLATITLGDGSVRRFSRANATAAWASDTTATDKLIPTTLANSAPGWRYTSGSNESIRLFNANGQIISHTQRNGWAMNYTYNAANQLTSITNRFGRSLSLAYYTTGVSTGLLSSITTPGGQIIRYEYDSSQRLSIVRYADNTLKQYLYENTTFPHLLTGVVDENNTRLSTYSYDSEGRAIETTKQGGADRYQVSYGNAGNQITSATITDPLGTPRTYNYATSLSQLAVTGADKPSGNGQRDAASRVQNALGLIESETDFLGFTTQYSWDTARRLKTSETVAAGRPEAQTTQTTWHPTFRLPAQTIVPGKTTAYTYDSLGNLLTQTETDTTGNASNGQTRQWSYAYNANSQMTTMTDPRGQVWTYTYDGLGNRASSTNPLGHASANTFDGAGRMLTETAPNSLVTSYQYDPRGRVTRITVGSNLAVALQQTTLYTYKPSGQIASAALPNGHAISYSYDAAQRLVAAADNRGNAITYTLDAMGNRISEQIKDASQQIALSTQRVINSLNRVEAIKGGTNPSAQTTAFQYDANGQPIKSTDPLGNATETFLDALRRPIATKLPDASQADSYYNQLNQLTQAVDPKGISTQFTRNAWGEVLSETSPDIGQQTYTRDAGGNPLTLKDAKNQTTSYQYDALSRVTSISFADGKQQSFFYDGTATGQQKGYLREMQDSSGNTKYERDVFGRITKKTQTVLDNPANPTVLISQYTYTPAGELASIRYPSGLTVGYQRNASGQISGITTKIGSAAALPFVQNISYTALEQPKAWNWAHCTTASVAISPCTAASRSFDADGRMTSSNLATLQYDAASRITAITQNLFAQRSVSSTSGTATITTNQLYTLPISWAIGYDNRDRITSFTRSFSGVGQQSSMSESFTYDPNSNRLSSISINATDTDKDGLYEFSEQRKNTARASNVDAASNKLLGFQQNLTTLTGTRTNSTVASQINYTLDANGNLTSDGLRQFQYDGSDRLSKVILGSTFVGTDSIAGNELAAHTYLHNAAGQRVFKSEPRTEATAPNEATLGTGFVSWLQTNFSWLWSTAQTNATLGDSFLYADGQLPSWALLGQYGNGGASSTGRTEYIWLPTANGQAIPIGMYRSGQLHAIHTDHLGTPRLMVDRNNTPVWQWAYSAFGDNAPTGILKPTTSAGSAFISTPAGSNGNTSATLLATSNPTQINNLRFPGQYADSETGLFYNYFRSYQPNQGRYTQNDPIGLAGGWNRFAYVEGNPLMLIDPEGLQGTRSGNNFTPLPVNPFFDRMNGMVDGGGAGTRGSSNAARQEAMRQAGIPTSQQPVSQSRNSSGREYSYDVPALGGGTNRMSVQQQTMDRSHVGQPHWEAGRVKIDPLTGQVRYNDFGSPRLTNDKSKICY
jgi:RHS repeat-associated protein